MDDLLTCEIRFREDETRQSPGVLSGTLVTYLEIAGDRKERFLDGSLQWPEKGIIVDEMHNRAAPILRTLPYLEGRAIKIEAPLPNTARGRDAGMMVQDGTFRGLSVTFHALRESRRAGVREISSALLIRAGLVDDPSYAGSTVEVRAKVWQLDREDLLRWL